MKELLAVISLLVSGAVAEPPAPYPPSGWRPSGPAFDLPQRGQSQEPQYLPPVDPRNQAVPSTSYGIPDDVSVQGLPPPQEQQPIFQASPINGQQYQGPTFNSDIRNLDQSFKQTQYQIQQENYRQLERQRQLDAARPNNKANILPSPQPPRAFVSRTTPAPASTSKPEQRTTETPATQVTEANLNEREILEDDTSVLAKQKAQTSVEISKQNIQQYPGELFLSALAQYQLQPQFVPLQQIKATYLQPALPAPQKQVGFDGLAHLSALPSVLAQQQAASSTPTLLIGEQANSGVVLQQPLAQYQPVNSYQPLPQPQPQYQEPIALQPQNIQPNYLQPNPDAVAIQQPAPQYQTAGTYQPQVQTFPQFQAQRVVYQPQVSQFSQPQPEESLGNLNGYEENKKDEYEEKRTDLQQPQQFYQQPQQAYQQPQQFYQQPQEVYQQPQGVYQQPQEAYQPPQEVYQQPQQLYQQPLIQPQQFNQYQTPQQVYPAQLVNQDLNQYYQASLIQPQFQGQIAQQQTYQGPDALQSGLDANQEGNDIENTEEKELEDENDDDEGSRTTAVATVFGARTQPRVFPKYGAPFPVPKVQANPGYATTTESTVEDITEQGPVIAQAVAVSTNEGKKSAKLRSRRIRPVFTLDRSGHLVLASGQ